MKLVYAFIFGCILVANVAGAQDQNMQETARGFMRTGDFENAILVLNRALQGDKANLELQKDLAMSYYLKRDYAKALEQVKPMVERDDADVITYQIAWSRQRKPINYIKKG